VFDVLSLKVNGLEHAKLSTAVSGIGDAVWFNRKWGFESGGGFNASLVRELEQCIERRGCTLICSRDVEE
jgi:hypothetical protein